MDSALGSIPHEALAGQPDPLSQACHPSQPATSQERSLTASPVGNSMDGSLALEKEEDLMKSTAPHLKLDDAKSWLWLQKAIHPEVDYDGCLQKRWLSSKARPWKSMSIKKWMMEMRQKRKEEERLRRAEVHAAMSVAGVAAALAAVAAENAELNQTTTSKENAVASAAALVAAQCAERAEAAGATREQLRTAMDAAVASTEASSILTLTAAASTSLRGAATLRSRPGRKEGTNSVPTLPTEESKYDFIHMRSLLAKGTEIPVVTADGTSKPRLVCVVLNRDAKVILKMKKGRSIMGMGSTQESIVHDLQGSNDKDTIQEEDSYYSIVLGTSHGEVKLKIPDFESYRIWTMAIRDMLKLSTSFATFEYQFYEK